MKVLTICGVSALGGSETFFVSLTLALQRAGVHVRAGLRHNAVREHELQDAGVLFDVLPFYRPLDPITGLLIRGIARAYRPDVVLTITGRGAAMTPPGNYALIGRLGGYYKLSYFRRCDHLVCNTPHLLEYVVRQGWPLAHVSYIPNFPQIQDDAAVDRDVFDTPNRVPLAVALGRLHSDKGLDTLLRAIAKIPDLWLWIAGVGPLEEPLKRLANDLGIASRVRFVGWRTDRSALFKAADLCIFPSREEPFGNVVLEAWAYGVPLVATASKGPAWLIRPDHDAMLVPVDNVDDLACAVRQVLSSESLRRKLVTNGLERIAGEFSEKSVIGRYIQMFEQVSQRPATR